MKRITLLAILCIVTVSVSFSQHFRQHSWGDSMEKVKEVECNKEWIEWPPDLDFLTTIGFVGTVRGNDAVIGFYFVEDKLYSGLYLFREDHDNDNEYLTDFDDIDYNLQSKYGDADVVEREWKIDTWKDDRDMWGFALRQGHFTIYSGWVVEGEREIDATTIEHHISSEDYYIYHRLEYRSALLSLRHQQLLEEINVF